MTRQQRKSVCCKGPQGLSLKIFIFFTIVLLVGIVVACLIKKYNSENFRTLTENGTTFRKIGTGVAIDSEAMASYLTSSGGGFDIPYTNINQSDLQFNISESQHKLQTGFIPPSFTFYPFGKLNKAYNFRTPQKNETVNEKGDEICMEACSSTDCVAVQTEVAQNCAFEPLEPGSTSSNTCGETSEAGCTLYYSTVEDADDAYWDISNRYTGGEGGTFVGEKYYDLAPAPASTPSTNGSKPSRADVPWCGPSITKPDPIQEPDYDFTPQSPWATNYEKHTQGRGIIAQQEVVDELGVSIKCSCIGDTTDCNDPNCCKYRELLTSKHSRYKHPFYRIPVSAIDNSYCEATTDGGDACGKIDDLLYKSCPKENLLQNPDGDYWDTSPQSMECIGESEEALKVCYSEMSTHFNDLQDASNTYTKQIVRQKIKTAADKCCGTQNRACINRVLQPSCDPDVVERGCFGDPPILNVHEISNKSNLKACSDETVIPSTRRCVNQNGLVCLDFPYSCKSGTLWIPN